MVTVEQILDLLADELINAPEVDLSMVRGNQKTIRNGLIQLGRDNSEKLILFEKDVKANEEDFTDVNVEGNSLTSIVEAFAEELDISQCSFDVEFDSSGDTPIISSIVLDANGTDITMTNIFYNGNPNGNPINLSQFMNLQELTQDIDIGLAEEYLDTTIFELLPDITLRQQRIIDFFNEFQNLVGTEPSFNVGSDGLIDVDENNVFLNNNIYTENHDISTAQDGDPSIGIQEEDSFITRLEQDANSNNEQYTLQGLRNTLNQYLEDIDQELPPLQDERPTYINQSDGYLKFRNLNQGIIIRNTEGDTINSDWNTTGFSITMWVKFLDKVSSGTLFNFGNPTRAENPFGFKLETYVLNKDDDNPHSMHGTWGDGADAIYNGDGSRMYFENSNTARFVRLVVNDNGTTRDSHIGVPGAVKQADIPDMDGDGDDEFRLLQTTFIPEDFQEWYFICASFNPTVDEDDSYVHGYNNDPNFWLNHINPDDGLYTNSSNYGNRCKVEIISRSDLLRARGFNS